MPISLFVTLEIVKFWQGFVFINCDREMRDPMTGEGARCRNSNLNEDLGKVDYIFSDKTGTLTSNEMRLRLIAIKGQPLGDLNKRVEDHGDLKGFPGIKFFSEQMHTAIQVRKTLVFAALEQFHIDSDCRSCGAIYVQTYCRH